MASSVPFSRLSVYLSFILLSLITLSNGLSSSDTITWGGSSDRSAYETNHNMDPEVVASAQFGMLYKTKLPGSWSIGGNAVEEQIYASPLVYTGGDGIQYVYLSTTQNNVYKINAKTGAIVASRNLHRPFLTSDLDSCNDIAPLIGNTATGVIDPATDTWYLTTKTYLDQNPNGAIGRPNGRYYVHAISTVDLSERSNFPLNLEGTVARNNPVRVFGGGIHHQRPALLQQGQYIYAGFASHCIQYNYTGWIMGWDKTTGAIVERYSTEGAGTGVDIKGAGIWMSGGGIASDGKGSIYFSSGNGYAAQLDQTPVSGRNAPSSLEEAVVHMAINDNGSLNITDFFMPWEKKDLDGADKDLGTTPFQLLPSQFSCGNVNRMGVVTGKSGKTYWLNLDDLGGYRNGPNRLDKAIQVYQHENSVYSGAGVYPLEGGYIYINVIKYPTRAFKFSCDNGTPNFNPVALSKESTAFALGTGHGTTTSLNNQPGTGLYWVSDVENSNLRVYRAVPVDGTLVLINSFNTPGTTKFSKLSFGDGIVFQVTNVAYLYAYGSPVNLPLNCTGLQFGSVNINATSSPQTVHCVANAPVTVTTASIAGNPNFAVQGLPILPTTVDQGQNFSFQVVFTPKSVGSLSSSVILNTTSNSLGYSNNIPVQLKGTGQSQAPLLALYPQTVTWNGYITGQQTGGVNQSVVLANRGNTSLTVTSIKYSTTSEQGPWITPNGTINATLVTAFTFYSMPSVIPSNSEVVVPINFNPTVSGPYATYIRIESTGGSAIFDAFATGSGYPMAQIEMEGSNSTWTRWNSNTSFSFGNVFENTNVQRRLRISNVGGLNAAALSLTVSKPPYGMSNSIIGTNNNIDLAEGTLISAGFNQTATLFCSPPRSNVNMNSYNQTVVWTMNMNDPTFGHQLINLMCNAVTEQLGPLDSVGQAVYAYGGCYQEFNPDRQFSIMAFADDALTTDTCIRTCSSQGYIFAATQYRRECWCGNTRPKTVTLDDNCNYACGGAPGQICGGNGIAQNGTYMTVYGDKTRWNGDRLSFQGPLTNPGLAGFSAAGCIIDNMNPRPLGQRVDGPSTVSGCLSACKGYQYVGIEYGGECYCDNALDVSYKIAADADCGMVCIGNTTEYCGGPNRMNLYKYNNTTNSLVSSTTTTNTISTSIYPTATATLDTTGVSNTTTSARLSNATLGAANTTTVSLLFTSTLTSSLTITTSTITPSIPSTTSNLATTVNVAGSSSVQTTTKSVAPSGPTIVPSALGFTYMGCYTETVGRRAISGIFDSSTNVDVEYCATFCSGYTYMAVEFSQECFCANTITPGSTIATDGRCSMACIGDATEICGGSYGLSLYKYSPDDRGSSSSLSSSLSSSNTPSAAPSTMPSATPSTTPSTTLLATPSTKSPTTPLTTPSTAPSTTPSATPPITPSTTPSTTPLTTPSTTPSTTLSTTPLTTPSTLPDTTPSTKPSTTPSSASPTSTTSSSPWIYQGCASDKPGARTLSQVQWVNDGMTIEKCQTFCTAQNMPYSGVEYSTECYCDWNLSNGGALGATNPDCTMPCAGNQTQQCGGPNRLSVYKNTSWSPPKNRATIGSYQYAGCYVDTSARILGGGYMFGDSKLMTQELCINTCSSKGYKLAGVEWAQECWCANLNPQFTQATKAPDSECNMMCKGDPGEWCGSSMRLSVWASP